ncbi:MAG: toprim domain-containing protein [Magnetococcales bacterium]|nr:toprim domain-containing protein [Magnetococcales bacterium]
MNAAQLAQAIDLHTLASQLGLRRHGADGNYFVPWRGDQNPSLSIFKANDRQRWKDQGTDDHGDAVDLVRKVKGMDIPEAMRFLHQNYGIPFDSAAPVLSPSMPAKLLREQHLWQRAKTHPAIASAADYLIQTRRLPEEAVRRWQGKTFGFSDYTPKDGDPTAHGPAIVFPVTDTNGVVIALNLRYLADGHEPRMRTIGEAAGGMFLPRPEVRRAAVIWLVESPIDALTLDAAGCPAAAFLSASWADHFSFSWLTDRQRLMVLGDKDEAGKKAAGILYHRALSAVKTAQIVDWQSPHKDPNDALQAGMRLEEVRELAQQADTSLFPAGAPWMPETEYKRLSMFVCGLDCVDAVRAHHGDGEQETTLEPVTGFRIFRIDPITVHAPETAFGGAAGNYAGHKRLVTYRRADSPLLHRRVIDATDLGKPTVWMECGQLHNSRHLSRMLQTLSRDQRQQHETVGVYGLVMVNGVIQLMDSSNGYLTEKECIYHNYRFPSAPVETAKPILEKLNGLLKGGLGVIWFGWFVGSMLKVYLGFWPHLAVSGHAGSGKTLIAKRVLCALTGCLSQEPTTLQTPYRRVKVVSNHLLPVVFDEISRASQSNLNDFVDLLNSCYRHDFRPHGQEGGFRVAAPVCLVGQDNPIEDAAINSKLIQFDIDGEKIDGGLFTPEGQFPMQEWAAWLQRWDRPKAELRLRQIRDSLSIHLQSAPNDSNTGRFLENYAALQFALEELCAFSGYDDDKIFQTLPKLMNLHSRESEVIRKESVGILDRLARDVTLARKDDRPPFKVENGQLIISPKVMLDFLSKNNRIFPVKSSRRLVTHLKHDGFLMESNSSRRIDGQKTKAVVLDLKRMEEAGIDWPMIDDLM